MSHILNEIFIIFCFLGALDMTEIENSSFDWL